MKKEKSIKLTAEETRFFRYLRERMNGLDAPPFEEAARHAADMMEWAAADELRLEAARLEALDTTETKEHIDEAHINAADTCIDRGEDCGESPHFSTNYLRHYVATLATLVEDTAGEGE